MEKKKKIAVWAAFAISFIIVLYGLSSPIIKQFPIKTFDKNKVIDYSFNDKGGVIVTNSELDFIDKNEKICNIVSLNDIDNSFNYVRAITTDNDGYTILGYYYLPGAQLPDRVILAHCDLQGNNLKQIWSEAADKNELIWSEDISDILFQDGKLFAVSHDGKNLIISNHSDTSKQTFNVYSKDNTQFIQDVVFGDNVSELYLQNRFGNNSMFCISDGSNKDCPELKDIRYAWFDENELNTSYRYSILMWAKTVLFYLAVIVLMILVINLLFKLSKIGIFKKLRTALFVLIAVGIALGFFIFNIVKITKSNQSVDIVSTANRIKYAIEQISEEDLPLPDSLESTEAFFEDQNNRSSINEIILFVKNFSNTENTQSVSFIKIILADEEGNNCVYADSEDMETCGRPSRYFDFLAEFDYDSSDDLKQIEVEDSEYKVSCRTVNMNNRDYDMIVMVATDDLSNVTGLEYEIMFEVYQFIAIVLSIYIALEFLSNCFKNVNEFKNKRRSKDNLAGVSLSNIFMFSVEFICHVDYFLLVMVTEDICKNVSPAQLALFLALPLTTYRVGSIIGSSLTGWVVDKIGYRKTTVMSAVFTMAAFALMAYSCIVKNIYLLSVAKFIQGIFLDSILYTLADGLPYQIEDREERERRIAKCQSAGNAGIVLSIMVGGIISQYISYTIMYIVGAIMATVFILFAFLVFRKGMNEDTTDEISCGGNTGKSPWTVFIRPKIALFLVMVIIPYVLIQGYEDYLFPLFSESKGLNDLTLCSIGVIANSLSYYGERILVFFRNISKVFAIVIALGICGILLMLLTISPGITWAVLALLGINIISRVVDANKITYIADLAKDEGYDPIEIQERYYPIEDAFKIAQAPVLGAFATISSAFACVIVGLMNFLIPGGYEITLHRLKKKQKK